MPRFRPHLACSGVAWLASCLLALAGPARAAEEAASGASLDACVDGLFALHLAPGMAVAAVRDGELAYARGAGVADLDSGRPVTPETIFYIASTTKSLTAFAAALLAHQGAIDLDTPLNAFLPQAQLAAPLAASAITLRDLLALRHGIEDGGGIVFRTAYSGEWSAEQLVTLLAGYGPNGKGKGAFNYGNLGYNVAGLALEAKLGLGWKELVEREVLLPLGMRDTSAYVSRVDASRQAMPHAVEGASFRRIPFLKGDETMHAAGGHLSTVLDLARWLEVHLEEGRLDGAAVFPPEVVAETHREQVTQDREFSTYYRHGWGLGWDLGSYDGKLLVHRFGGFPGFRSHLSFMPAHGLGVVTLVNASEFGSLVADSVADCLYDHLLGRVDAGTRLEAAIQRTAAEAATIRQELAANQAERAARLQELPHPLAAYAGTYESPEMGRMEWGVAGDRLRVTIGRLASEAEVYDGVKNQLRVELTGGGDVAEFTFAGERATAVTLMGWEQTFRRTDG